MFIFFIYTCVSRICLEIKGIRKCCSVFILIKLSGISRTLKKNRKFWFIAEYMIEKLGMDADKVAELNVPLYKTYGTTMAGLKV